MRRGKATFGEFVAAVSGAALVVALFFAWYGYELGPTEASLSGWESLTVIDIVLAAIGALAAAQWVARRSGRLDRGPLPVAPAAVVALGGIVALALVLVRLADLPDAAAASHFDGRRVGAFLALAAAAGIILGALAALRERGERWRPRRVPLQPPANVAAPVVGNGERRPYEP